MRTFPWTILAAILAIAFLFPPRNSFSKRPEKEDWIFLEDILKEAGSRERSGDPAGADAKYQEYLKECRERFRNRPDDESRWLDYMKGLRVVIGFHLRKGKLSEADWFFREYARELEGDAQAAGMYAMLVLDSTEAAETLARNGKTEEAELTYLFLIDKVGFSMGHTHYLVGDTYRKLAGLYVRMNRPESAKECAEKAAGCERAPGSGI